MTKCPYCAEDIQERTIVCRNCGRYLQKLQAPLPQITQERGNWGWNTIAFAIVTFIFIAYGIVAIILLWNSF